MPTFSFSIADFVAFTKIRSADVNTLKSDITTFLNTTKIDDDNIQNAGITRATKLKLGTADHVLINDGTGAMSSEAQLNLTRGGTGASLSLAGNAGKALRVNSGETSLTLETIVVGDFSEPVSLKADMEKYNLRSDNLNNTFYQSFLEERLETRGFLLDSVAGAATTMVVVFGPQFLQRSNPNSNFDANWTNNSDATNINTTATVKIGSSALSFDKSNTSTEGSVRINLASLSGNVNISKNLSLWFWVNLPSTTNLSSIVVKGSNANGSLTDSRQWTATTNYAGSALTTGWNLINIDLSAAGSTNGSGWDPTATTLGTFGVGVISSSSAQTYAELIFDAIAFAPTTPSKRIQAGDEVTIYDSTNSESIRLDVSNTTLSGVVTLAAAISNSYTGGSGTFIYRNSLSSSPVYQAARFGSSLAGAASLNSQWRLKKYFQDPVSNATFQVQVKYSTQLIFVVGTVTSSTEIKCTVDTDISAQVTSGQKYFVFKTFYKDSEEDYAYRNLQVTVASSSYNTGVLTITNSGANTGIAVGDTIVVTPIATYFSCVDATTPTNETFGTALTVSDAWLEQGGLRFPRQNEVYGYWPLGTYKGVTGLAERSGLPSAIRTTISSNGTVNTTFDFKNGLYAAGTFSTTNYLQLGGTVLGNVQRATVNYISGSFWVYPTSVVDGILMDARNTAGWFCRYYDGRMGFGMSNATQDVILTCQTTFQVNTWNHVAFSYKASGTAKVWVNGSLSRSGTAGNTSGGSAAAMRFGQSNATDLVNTAIYLADFILWDHHTTDSILTDEEVALIYNRGAGILLGQQVTGLREIYTVSGQTGQKVGVKVDLKRVTTAVAPQLQKISCAKVN